MINEKIYLFDYFSQISKQKAKIVKIINKEFILMEFNFATKAFPRAISLLLDDYKFLLFPSPSAKLELPLHSD